MRVGPQMRRVAELVGRHPGMVTRHVALTVGPSQRFGYATVDRAIRAGLIETYHDPSDPPNWTRLRVPER